MISDEAQWGRGAMYCARTQEAKTFGWPSEPLAFVPSSGGKQDGGLHQRPTQNWHSLRGSALILSFSQGEKRAARSAGGRKTRSGRSAMSRVWWPRHTISRSGSCPTWPRFRAIIGSCRVSGELSPFKMTGHPASRIDIKKK